MSTFIGPTYAASNATSCFGYFDVSSSNISNTVTRISVSMEIRERGGWWSDGCRMTATCNGSSQYIEGVLYSASSTSSSGTQMASGTKTFDITRTTSAQSISVSLLLKGQAVGGKPAWASANTDGYTKSATVSVPALPVPTAPTNCVNTRNDDNKNTITWTNGSNITGTVIERKTNSDEWSVLSDSVSSSATSYVDSTTTTDNAYQYRVKHIGYGSQTTSYATSGTTYNTPATPSTISGARVDGTVAGITLTNESKTATSTQLQYSTDKSSWNDATTTDTKATYIEWDTGGGQYYFRARNKRGNLASAWTDASNLVVTVTPPSAPTLTSPSSGLVVPKSQQNITFVWQHNPIDGSAQTAAELQYSTNGGSSWSTATATTAQTLTIPNNFAVNATVTWRARTKGAAESYGPYSGTRTFVVYQVPSVSFVANNPPSSVSDMPIPYQLSYTDQSGSFAGGTVTLYDANSSALYTEALDSTLAGTIASTEFTPANGATYTLVASVRSTSSLSNTGNATFTTAFVQPQAGELSVMNNITDGTVSLVVTYSSPSEGYTAATSATVKRGNTVLADHVTSGTAIIDRYAPLNTNYTYDVITHADNGSVNTVSVSNIIQSPNFFVYWLNECATGRWNPATSQSDTRPERTLIRYAGRQKPVEYDSKATEKTQTVSFTVTEREQAVKFATMMAQTGAGVFKSPVGEVMHAAFDLTQKPDYQSSTYYNDMTLTIIEVDGGDL